MTVTELRAAWAAEKRRPGALAAYLAASRATWAVTLAATPDRTKVLKWIARVRAGAVLRWQHEISPLTRDEIRGTGLVPAFLRKCEIGILRWLEEAAGRPEFKLTHPVMRAVIEHGGAAALATTEWIIAHTEGDSSAQKVLCSALCVAIKSGDVPLAHRLREFGNRDREYQYLAILSQSLEMVRLVNEWNPGAWGLSSADSIGRGATPEIAAFIMEQMGDEAFRNIVPNILVGVLCAGTVELATWLRETFPAQCTEETIRHLPIGNLGDALRFVLARSDPRPLMEWLEGVRPLVPADFSHHTTESIVRGEKSIETLRWCLDRYGGPNVREAPRLVSNCFYSRDKKKSLERARWLITTYQPLATSLWNYSMFWALSHRKDRLEFARELHALVPLTPEVLLTLNALRCIYSTLDCAFIRWIHHKTGVTLDDVRARTEDEEEEQLPLVRPPFPRDETAYIQYIDLLSELGGVTLADWENNVRSLVVVAARHGWAQVLLRARDAGVSRENIRPHLTECLTHTMKAAPLLTEMFGFSYREVRRAALCGRWVNKKSIELLVAECGATIEDLRENDYEVLRNNVAAYCGSTRLKSLSLLGVTPADALAVMDSLGEEPRRESWRYRYWSATRRELCRLARA